MYIFVYFQRINFEIFIFVERSLKKGKEKKYT